jgi:hypothetical protein
MDFFEPFFSSGFGWKKSKNNRGKSFKIPLRRAFLICLYYTLWASKTPLNEAIYRL